MSNQLTYSSLCVTAGADLSPDALAEKVKEKLAVMLMMPADDIDPAQPMINYGVDSLTSIDIAAWMMKEFQVSQAAFCLVACMYMYIPVT